MQASNNIRKFTVKNRKDSKSLTSDCPYDQVDYKMLMAVEAAMVICQHPDVFEAAQHIIIDKWMDESED